MKRLKDKLYNYEVSPPPRTWNKIASELDQSLLAAEFPNTLYNLEIKPPASAWLGIESALEREPATVVPVHSNYNSVWRYAAAAAVIAMLFFAGFMFFNSRTGSDTENISTVSNNNKNPGNDVSIITPQKENITAQEAQDNQALEESKQTFARLDLPKTRTVNTTAIEFDEPVRPQVAAFTDIQPQNTYRELCYVSFDEPVHEDNLSTTATRYVLLMTPDGQFIRMSRKLSDLVCCVAGEDQDAECRDQISNWRQKIASSTHSASPGNFMDILNLVKSLQENRE
jgi:hypothetical protein